MTILTLLFWYLWVECLGLLALALAWPMLRALPDRGYCAAKTLGTLVVGLFLWWGFALGVLGNSAGGAALAVLAVAAVAATGAAGRRGSTVRSEMLDWIRRHWRLVATIELVQLAAFAGWCWVRANDPAADHTEEPMDLMLLVAVSSSHSFPPADPWLSGYPISYYYLGYWLLATLGHLAGSAPEVTYNLGQATWFAFLLVGSFGLAYNLTALSGGDRDDDDRDAKRNGLLAALLVGLTANLALPLEWARRYFDGTSATLWSENWWWWRSSRVVSDVALDGSHIETITEFPFFSYLLGDNHPHVLAMPIVVAVLTLALAVFVSSPSTAPLRRRRGPLAGLPGGGPALLGTLAVAGSIAAINTWDVPAIWSILVIAVAAAAAGSEVTGWRRALTAASAFSLLLVLGTAIFYLPYHLTASSQVEGILPNFFHPTPLGPVLVMFATLVPGAALLVMGGWERGRARLRHALTWWIAIVALAVGWLLVCIALATWGGMWSTWLDSMLPAGSRDQLLPIVLTRWSAGWPTLVVVTAGLALTLEALRARWATGGVRDRPGVTFALLLIAMALALILAPELVYLHDSFGTRMNTVFKFWYQAWLLLACSAAVGLGLAWRRGGGARAAALIGLLVIAPGLYYPVMGLWTKTSGFGSPEPTLDALASFRRYRPDEVAAVEWVRRSTDPGAIVVQRSGASYRPEHNLPSIISGRPTLLGWGGHEFQWRGASFSAFAAGRDQALTRIYQPASASDLASALAEWHVDYVYLGPEERALYGVDAGHESVIAAAMDLVFENAQVRIFQRRG